MDKEKAKSKFNTTDFHQNVLIDIKRFIDNGRFFGDESTIVDGITPTKELKEQMKMMSSEASQIPEIKNSKYVLDYIKGDNIGGSHQENPEVKEEMTQIVDDLSKRRISEKADYAIAVAQNETNKDRIKDTSINLSGSYFEDAVGYDIDEQLFDNINRYRNAVNKVIDKEHPELRNSVGVALMPKSSEDKDDMDVNLVFSKSAFKTRDIDVNDFLKAVSDVYEKQSDIDQTPTMINIPENDSQAKSVPVYKRIVDQEFVAMTDKEWSDVSSVKKQKLYEAFDEESPVKKANKSMLSMKL